MTAPTLPRNKRSSERGVSSVEFAIILTVFLMTVMGIVDFGRALWQWNLAARATEVGVRLAAVNDPIALNVRGVDGTVLVLAGEAPPPEALSPNPTVCAEGGCGASLTALDPLLQDQAAFQDLVAAVRAYNPGIAAANLVVEYRHVGVGLAGNTEGPDLDPIVTVSLRDLELRFHALRFLQIPPLRLPDFRASLSAEDAHGT
jgi:hypothetical protein